MSGVLHLLCPNYHSLLVKATIFCLEIHFQVKELTLDFNTKFLNSLTLKMRPLKTASSSFPTESPTEKPQPVPSQPKSANTEAANHIKATSKPKPQSAVDTQAHYLKHHLANQQVLKRSKIQLSMKI
jgi:hypothetical protein